MIPVQAYYRPRGFKETEAPKFWDNWHMKVVRLSALHTGCLIPQEIFLVRISVRGQVGLRAIVQPEDRNQRKIPMKPSGIEPANFHNVVPQPAAPLCGSMYSSLSRHSIAIQSPNPIGVYSCIHVALPASDWMWLWVTKTFTWTLTIWTIDFHTNIKNKM